MPSAVPWFVYCGRGGLSVSLGDWRNASGRPDEGIDTDNVFGLTVAFVPFSDEHCQRLVVSAGKSMLAITATGQQP